MADRAVEAAQAAMASPLLEAGAIDGARGILINITGSSALKLSEVNAASSLIQEAAHEDANIIFGAVLDEKMGDEVKITVIATGFRDQMPERRARMLTVEETPVVSVPVLAADNWMREPIAVVTLVEAPSPAGKAAPSEPPSPPAPRFMSEDDEMEEVCEDEDEGPVFAAATASAQPAVAAASETERFEKLFADQMPARPRFAEISEESAFKPLPRDYATDLGNGVRLAAAAEEQRPAAGSLFAEKPEEMERDLEVPAFMRRMQF